MKMNLGTLRSLASAINACGSTAQAQVSLEHTFLTTKFCGKFYDIRQVEPQRNARNALCGWTVYDRESDETTLMTRREVLEYFGARKSDVVDADTMFITPIRVGSGPFGVAFGKPIICQRRFANRVAPQTAINLCSKMMSAQRRAVNGSVLGYAVPSVESNGCFGRDGVQVFIRPRLDSYYIWLGAFQAGVFRDIDALQKHLDDPRRAIRKFNDEVASSVRMSAPAWVDQPKPKFA